MKKVLMFLIMGLFLISLVSANTNNYGTFKKNDCIELKQVCASCTYVNISISYPNSTRIITNDAMANVGSGVWVYDFCNTSVIGRYDITGEGDLEGNPTGFNVFSFEITTSGISYDASDGIVSSILIVFFLSIIIGLYVLNKSIDYEKWNNSIIRRYENKNYIKLVLSSITYNLMKNTFILYYLLIFPILLVVMDMAYNANNISMIGLIPSFFVVYSVGIIILGIYFIGYVQEWFMSILDEIKNINWGIQ